ncbi:MAG: glycosyltransferase [Melioribacteraceae bacterium]|nr:glycosyltransferase [Melioribacteraceae bacterium]MCF8263423.1 glycosyltransferase [Melioribacteraceae bacterium]MCF8414257.1 glycosyltransferase [Melioribacteraceae bacterium]MCF8430421.1 glycosyltransferase [Melioribacteraceae bacterium]
MKKKVLFISYYWPPSGKASLHWPVNVIKHLAQSDWEPIVLTVNAESFTEKDYSLLSEISPELKVIKTPVFEVFDLYKKFIGKKKGERLSVSETMSVEGKSWQQKFSMWLRMNFFIPDARVTWYPSAVKHGKAELKKFLGNEKLEAIISIGTPHSTHLIGKKLAKFFGSAFIPFFSDPWTSISYYEKFKRSSITSSLDLRLEANVLKNAHEVIFVTRNTEKEYLEKYPFLEKRTNVLYWGYNEEKFSGIDFSLSPNEEKIILHSGNLFDYQNPAEFWKTVKKQIDSGNKLRLHFTGTVGPRIKESIKENGLEPFTNYLGFVSYDELLNQLGKADYLLECSYNSKHIPGKTFEYLRTAKPIIAFGDNPELGSLISEANAGMLFDYTESGEDFFEKVTTFKTDEKFVSQFERQNITQKLIKILEKVK